MAKSSFRFGAFNRAENAPVSVVRAAGISLMSTYRYRTGRLAMFTSSNRGFSSLLNTMPNRQR